MNPIHKPAMAFFVLTAATCTTAQADTTCWPLVLPTSQSLTLAQSDPDAPWWDYFIIGDGVVDVGLGGPGPDLMHLGIYSEESIGTLDLSAGDEANYASCMHCVLLMRDEGSAAAKIFFPATGTLGYSNAPGTDPLPISLSNLRLVEVTIDSNTFVSTPVPNGECYTQATDSIFESGFES